MDQGVLIALKLRYKKKLLRRLLIEDDRGGSVVDFLKSVDMKVVEFVAEAWDEIKSDTLQKSWRKIEKPPKEFLSSDKEASNSVSDNTQQSISISHK